MATSRSPETESPAMVSGDSSYNYSQNSTFQREFGGAVKVHVEELIAEKLDPSILDRAANTFRIADFGCSVGPNTFHNVQHIVENVREKFVAGAVAPEFQVFFNDQTTNDFNALFRSLPPERDYFAGGVPGSFRERLFPSSSLHFAYSSMSVHWLSTVPPSLNGGEGELINKGRIHYGGAAAEVEEAYREQFGKDMGGFLNARAEELVSGGMMVIVGSGVPDGMDFAEVHTSFAFDCLALSTVDLVREGLLAEERLDSFNLPMYYPHPSDIRELVKMNGSFDIETIELFELPAGPWQKGNNGIESGAIAAHLRAAMEGLFVPHFGPEFTDSIFGGLAGKLGEIDAELLESKCREKVLLYVALRRM